VGVPESGEERERARQYVLDTMGQSKISVFLALFGSEDRAQQANIAFERAYERLIDEGRAKPIDGAAEAISRIRDAGVRVALTTGFSSTTQEKLLAALGWQSPCGSGARAGRRCARTAVSGSDPHRADATRRRRRPQRRNARRHQQRHRKRGCAQVLRSPPAPSPAPTTSAIILDAGATHVVDSVTEFADLILQDR